jgi:acyl CoA:acetate/3-ketoacid CoA transferase beta subunit
VAPWTLPWAEWKAISLMEHVAPSGQPEIVRDCTYPLTASGCVEMVITDFAVVEVTEKGPVMREVAPGWTIADVQQQTEARLPAGAGLHGVQLSSIPDRKGTSVSDLAL